MSLATPINLRRPLIIASRGSKLALQQATTVQNLLTKAGIAAEISVITTSGDRIQDRFLYEMGGKGLFVKELEQALLNGSADLAVHSLKDLPAEVKKPFYLAAFLKRGPCEDALVLPRIKAELLGIHDTQIVRSEDFLRLGRFRMGTGSLRRRALLTAASPHLDLIPIRGNVDTRLGKLLAGDYDGLVIARAALERLAMVGHPDFTVCTIDPAWFIPCASQGALVIETLAQFPYNRWLADTMDDAETTCCVEIERAVLAALGGDCTLPIGVHATVIEPGAKEGAKLRLRGVMADLTGRQARHEMVAEVGDHGEETKLALNFAHSLLSAGGFAILANLGKGVPPGL